MYFTICIPVYNREKTIIRTLESLDKQSFKDFEIIIVDDGSTDKTKEVVNEYINNIKDIKFRYIYKLNGGKHSALNTGIKEARGKFFLILDSDDYLLDNALEVLYNLCLGIENDDTYSGVLARCKNLKTGELIGGIVPAEIKKMSYIDFHFKYKTLYNMGDCIECNKTEILKKYRFPEEEGMKFVPEAYVFDQIGLKYDLLYSKEILEVKEYMEGGITLDKNFKIKNNKGYMYHYVSRIDNILKNTKLPLKDHIIAWWRYFEALSIAKKYNNKVVKVEKLNFLAYLVFLAKPLIDLVYKIKYREIYESGR